jgi:hypothetical protein
MDCAGTGPPAWRSVQYFSRGKASGIQWECAFVRTRARCVGLERTLA